MIPVADALAKVIEGVSPLPSEVVGLNDALGRVLAEAVASRVTQPPVAVSSMDGYAVRAADLSPLPACLALAGEAAAGAGFDGALSAGRAVRIFTGAPVPEGADAVVMQEDTERQGEQVTIKVAVEPGNFIRPAGMDFSAGQELLPKGRVMSARDVALAAAMNVPWLRVVRRPRVAILATGNELVMPGEALGPHQILSSNTLALTAMVRAMGGEPVNLGIARDDENSVRALAAGAKGADILVTIGGASVGDYDLVRQVLGETGLKLDFYKVAMRPGKPLIFGHVEGTPMLGLPGNPVSAIVTAAIFLRAAIETMQGIESDRLRPERGDGVALLGCDLKANDRRRDYLRAVLSRDDQGRLIATPFKGQDSALLERLAQADCLVIRPPEAPAAQTGEAVSILHLGGGVIAV